LNIKRNINPKEICDQIKKGNITALSKAITLSESNIDSDQELANKILAKLKTKNNDSIRIGITGVPGAGKSTFIESFGNHITNLGLKLAVLTIDPSSSVTKGSILGDKTRMETLSANKNVFIRPSPASNFQGGVGKNTRESIFLCESAGYDIILIETVGVGQIELDVMNCVDCLVLSLVPESGDDIQTMKAGLMEAPDIFVINKSDRSGSGKVEVYIKSMLEDNINEMGRLPSVIQTSNKDPKSIDKLYREIVLFWGWQKEEGLLRKNINQRYEGIIKDNIKNIFEEDFWNDKNKKDLKEFVISSKSKQSDPIAFSKKLFKKWRK